MIVVPAGIPLPMTVMPIAHVPTVEELTVRTLLPLVKLQFVDLAVVVAWSLANDL
jgi:hypothetical protein